MQKAEHDLLAAAHVLELDEPLTDIAVYHCQQAAEKALKAFLVEHVPRSAKPMTWMSSSLTVQQ